MRVLKVDELSGTDRDVKCPKGGFISYRPILESDGMGFTICKTFIPKGDWQCWHYSNHLEACYCVSGSGVLFDVKNDKYFDICEDSMYILDEYDEHRFKANEDVLLICVFNPPLKGKEVHDEDGSYKV